MNTPPNTHWIDGPPPSYGWWPTRHLDSSLAKTYPELEMWYRWWNGEFWSEGIGPVDQSMWADFIEVKSSTKSVFAQDRIQWTHRPDDWPAQSYT